MGGSGPSQRIGVPLLAALLLVGGCTGGPEDADGQARATPSSASAASAPSDDAVTEAFPAAPTATPAASSGDLSASVLPMPEDLGAGWEARVEGADEEEGVGNGTPFQERDPAEITETVLPMGCEVRSPSPVPENALQATYAHSETGAYAVALRMRFATDVAAAEFAAALLEDLETCARQPDDPFSGAPAPVLEVSASASGHTARYRLVGEPAEWIRGLRVEGSDVLTLDSDATPELVDWVGQGYQSP